MVIFFAKKRIKVIDDLYPFFIVITVDNLVYLHVCSNHRIIVTAAMINITMKAVQKHHENEKLAT